MLLDAITALVRRLGPLRLSLAVTALTVAVSAVITTVTMSLMDGPLFPALYLAIVTPFVLALPTTLLAFAAVQRVEIAKQQQTRSEQAVRAAQKTLSDAVESFPNPTLILDADDRVTLFNRAWRDYYPDSAHAVRPGIRYEELAKIVADTGTWDRMGSRDQALADRLRRHREGTDSFVQELSDGRFIMVNEARTADGGCIISHTDITDLKRVDALKDEFISMVSHELRTPLTSIRGSLDLLQSGMVADRAKDPRQFVDIAKRNADRLLHIVDDILEVQGIDAGQVTYDLQPVNLLALLKKTLDANAAYGDRLGVTYRLEGGADDMTVTTDAQRFDQVLTNLLSNAAKFSPNGSVITVSARPIDGFIRTSVHDQGPGIPTEHRARVFDRFWRSDDSDARTMAGTGLGLSIARKIAEGMGGRVGLDADDGPGATFYFDTPIANETHARDRDPECARETGDAGNVLSSQRDTVGLE